MRVTKNQIIHGITDYINGEIVPQMGDNKAVQIIIAMAINAIKSNNGLLDRLLKNDIVRAILKDDNSGTYEIDGIMDAMRTAIDQYGSFPVNVPSIPLISPREITLKLGLGDVDTLRQNIENAL